MLSPDIELTSRQKSIFAALSSSPKTMREIVAFVQQHENLVKAPNHRSLGNTMKNLRLALIEGKSAWRLITEGEGRGPGYRYVYSLVHHKQGD